MVLFSYIFTAEPLYNGHLGIDESGRCREVAVAVSFKQESMYVLSTKKSGRCGEVAVSGGVTILLK